MATSATSSKSASLPQETVDYLKAWMMSTKHISNPYPNKHEKAEIMAKTGIEPKQLTNWFVNNRKRYWQPRVEAKLQPAMAPSRLPQETVDYLKAWMMSTKHINYPYPTSASVPSSRKSERLLGKGKRREGASKYNAIEIKDSSSSDDESVDSDSTEEVAEERLGHNPELPKYNASLEKANAAKVVHESIGMKTRSGKNRGRKVLTDAENKLLLVYPFKGADEEMLVEASTGMKELSGNRLGVKDEMDVEEVEATANDSSDQNNDEATVEVKDWARAHYVTILQVAYNRLEPGQFLDDSLVDFWMRWISREQSHLGNKSDVHFFTTHFMSTLKKEPSSVASWTKKIDIFKKKLIFVPVNADNHCILFLDSLKIHRKDKVARIIRKWLDFEWKRKHGIEDPKQKFFFSRDMQLLTPKIPYQENGCDCGVFVCRYAYGLYLMRRQLFTPEDINDNFKGMITNGSAFAFDMKDIARIRGEFATLIDRLSPKYLAIKDVEEKAAKRAKKKAVAGETTVEKAMTVAASSTSTQRKEGATKRNAQYTETKRSKAKRKKLEPQKKMGEVGYTFRKQFDDGWFEGKVIQIRKGADTMDYTK
eukprot:g11502.t1 g11502   contig5:1019505-1021842(+)